MIEIIKNGLNDEIHIFKIKFEKIIFPLYCLDPLL
jgi:hypothetical protein